MDSGLRLPGINHHSNFESSQDHNLIRDSRRNNGLRNTISLVPGLVDAITQNAERLSLHNYGCRIIQRCLENLYEDQPRRQKLLDSIMLTNSTERSSEEEEEREGHPRGKETEQESFGRTKQDRAVVSKDGGLSSGSGGENEKAGTNNSGTTNTTKRRFSASGDQAVELRLAKLMKSQFGNYVIQCVYERGGAVDRKKIVKYCCDNVSKLATHKYGSNVLEKILGNHGTLVSDEIARVDR